MLNVECSYWSMRLLQLASSLACHLNRKKETFQINISHSTKFFRVLISAILCFFPRSAKTISPKFTPLAKLYIQISQVESCCCHLFKMSLSFKNKTMKWETKGSEVKKKSTGKDRLKLLYWEEHLQFRTRARCNWDRVKLITGLLCFTSLHFFCQLHTV